MIYFARKSLLGIYESTRRGMVPDMREINRFVDMDGALARMRGNKKLYRRMLGMFLASEEFAALEAALASGDYARAADVSHAIKGMVGNLSMPALFEASTLLNAQLKSGAPDEAAVRDYDAAYQATREHVEALAAQIDAEA